jgi:hypothetical protein
MTLAPCEHCDQRVGALAANPTRGGRRRLIRHKVIIRQGRFSRFNKVDWCPGKFERQEAKR